MQPLVLSPKVWMCMPRSALGSLPETFQEIWVSADSEACSKVTVPLTLESPRITATAKKRCHVSHCSGSVHPYDYLPEHVEGADAGR